MHFSSCLTLLLLSVSHAVADSNVRRLDAVTAPPTLGLTLGGYIGGPGTPVDTVELPSIDKRGQTPIASNTDRSSASLSVDAASDTEYEANTVPDL